MGVPKPRTVLVGPVKSKGNSSAGKIVVPGGRFKKLESSQAADNAEEDSTGNDWTKNGSGRVDVRGFKELKI